MRPFSTVGSFLFGVIALGHLVRVLLGWAITVDGVAIPAWPSIAVIIVFGPMAVLVWREARIVTR